MKNLNDITVTTKQILEFAAIHTFDGEFNSPFNTLDTSKAGFDASFGFVTNLYFSKGAVYYSAKRTAIQVDCDLSPDSSIIGQAFLYLANYPEAQKMLWHYLTGKGEELIVDTNMVFESDPNLKDFALSGVYNALKIGRLRENNRCTLYSDGHVNGLNFKQDQYANKRWQMAFGAINIRWEVIAEQIFIWFDDIYAWHPQEPRTDQCVHAAMTRAQLYGAKDFYYCGTKLRYNRFRFEQGLTN